MFEKEKIRRQVWADLKKVAKPDSRYHYDFSAFVPDFTGSDVCIDHICKLESYQQSKVVMVTPDNSLAGLRAQVLMDEKVLLVPTYALKRGFWVIQRADVPNGQELFAAMLDGMEYFAQPYKLEEGNTTHIPNLLVTGASVLNTQGIRLSDFPSYFDLEWLILCSLNFITPSNPVIACVHDVQVVDWPCQPIPNQTIVDLIVTPTRTLKTGCVFPKPTQFNWSKLSRDTINDIPLLKKLSMVQR